MKRNNDLPPAAEDDDSLPELPDLKEEKDRSQPSDDAEGTSPLLIDDDLVASAPLPDEAGAFDLPPFEARASEDHPRSEQSPPTTPTTESPAPPEQESILLLDDDVAPAPEPTIADQAAESRAPTPEETSPAAAEASDQSSEPLLLDDILEPETGEPSATESAPPADSSTVSSDATAQVFVEEPWADIAAKEPAGGEQDKSALISPIPDSSGEVESSLSPLPEIGADSWSDLVEGQSSLLMDSDQATDEAPAIERKRRRRRRERIRAPLPKPGKKVQWYSSPEACATYCRKHRRPLLLYFSTKDMEECRSFEEAIRSPEMQVFLQPYVCCMTDLSSAEGRQAAVRLGVPTDGPSIVLLAPSGRELARVLKPDIDWHFLAAMLFWVLR